MTDESRPTGFPDPREQPTLSIAETATWLGVGLDATYEGARNGSIPAIRVGTKQWRVPTADLARLLGFDVPTAPLPLDDGTPDDDLAATPRRHA